MNKLTNEMIIQKFHEYGLRATPQRISIFKFLKENPIHPSADTVYNEVIKEFPNFSRTTVYNSLNTLVEHGMAITVTLDDKVVRYDGNSDFHGHFKCLTCGKIIDFVSMELSYQGLDNCKIVSKDVYFKGYCPQCKQPQ